MNGFIVSFIVFGILFGAVTFNIRHLFSEGPAAAAGAGESGAVARLSWAAVCAMLWPLLTLTCVYGLWARQRRERRARASRQG